jgi:pimeloyl-ACP methyl ester carboxylesterase
MRTLLASLSLIVFAASSGSAHAQVGGLSPGSGRPIAEPNHPALPKLRPDSPRDTLLFSDRVTVVPAPTDFPPGFDPADVAGPTLVQKWVPATLTGTGIAELVEYQLPAAYDPSSGPIPLLVAWHGFGASAASVSAQTTLDEWCDNYGWAYLSVTGLDDALFGTTLSQQNAAAAIDWMLDTYSIDPDRVYMVGFSLGAGIVGNFAARHRDPDGIMIAGLGLVSGSFDWVSTWNNNPGVRAWLENDWNFGSPPNQNLYAYQRAGDLAFDASITQPSLATHQPVWAMATNLHDIPTYLTWDENDTLTHLPPQSETFEALLRSMGTLVLPRRVTGTVNPGTGQAAPHSWAVLDEAELFEFLAPRSVLRMPPTVDAQLDQFGEVSWLQLSQRTPGAFSWYEATVDVGARQIMLDGVINAAMLTLDLEATGLTGDQPIRVIATSGDSEGFTLRLAGGSSPPSYLVHSLDGQIVQAVESDPTVGALLTTVSAGSTLDISTVQLGWQSLLWLTPDPATTGSSVNFDVDAPTGSQTAWTLIGFQQLPTPIAGGVVLLVTPTPPALLFPLPLDGEGNVQIAASVPNNPALHGASLLLQAVIQGPTGLPSDVTNVFRFDIE